MEQTEPQSGVDGHVSEGGPTSERQVRVLLLGRFAVWVGDTLAISPANNLHKNLHYLRSVFADHGVTNAVSLSSQSVVRAPDVWADVLGINFRARKAANAEEWQAALAAVTLCAYPGEPRR